MNREYANYATEQAVALLAIDSPSGYTKAAAEWVRAEFEALGFAARITTKGGVLIDLGGEDAQDALLLEAHADTLGAMVAEIKASGALRVTNLGGMRAENGEAENVRIHTRSGRVYEGTLQLCNASVHVNGSYGDTKRSFDTTEVLIDEDVKTAEDTRALGIEVGDIVCFDPRTRVTDSGYIKSRFLDDKLSVGILLGLAKYIKDNGKTLSRKVYAHVTVYEEVGHGGAGPVPCGVTEAISVDMGCVGDGLGCTERKVSICAKDSGGLCGGRLSALRLGRGSNALGRQRHPPRSDRCGRIRKPRLRAQPYRRRMEYAEGIKGIFENMMRKTAAYAAVFCRVCGKNNGSGWRVVSMKNSATSENRLTVDKKYSIV